MFARQKNNALTITLTTVIRSKNFDLKIKVEVISTLMF